MFYSGLKLAASRLRCGDPPPSSGGTVEVTEGKVVPHLKRDFNDGLQFFFPEDHNFNDSARKKNA